MGNTGRKTDLLPGTLELLILKTLERSPAHGYGIARDIEQASSNVLRVEEGSLYPALQRLAVKGLVKSRWGQSENNRRARFYQLTSAGRRQLQREEADFELMLEAVLRVLQPV